MLNPILYPEGQGFSDHRSGDQPCLYQICVDEVLDSRWSCWFDGFTFAYDTDQTILTGNVVDQAALYGFLAKIGDLGASLISVVRL